MQVRTGSNAQEKRLPDKKLRAILDVYRRMSAERNLEALLELVAQEATRLMNADRASIFLLDRDKRMLWAPVALGIDPIQFDARLGIAGSVALTGDTINVADAQHDSRFYSDIDTQVGYQTRSVLATPLRIGGGEILGTFEVLNKRRGPFTAEDEALLKALSEHASTAIETARMVGDIRYQRDLLQEQNIHLRQEVESKFSTQNIIGTAAQMQRVVRMIERLRDSSENVLITGESGTGKELVAKALHYNSQRARQPFIALNCAALPEGLVETELFGIERGVATGVSRRTGKFELANEGTLFLDEIGDLRLAAQAKILRVLQERSIERVGSRKVIPVDVRILAATNKDLDLEIQKGAFREDLYFRLKVIHMHMPALREVRDDIGLLANHFLTNYCRELHKDPKRLTASALKRLTAYPWPGNVRELENEMRQIAVLSRRTEITEEELSDTVRYKGAKGKATNGALPTRSLKAAVEDIEKRWIMDALHMCRHNQLRAAKILGLSRQGLIKKKKRYKFIAS